VTPLSDRDTLDTAALPRLIEHVLSGGVHGLFILGTTGEGPSLSYSLRQEMIERACELVAGRVPVLVGVTDTSLADSLALAEWARDCGAAGVVAAPPPYMPLEQRDAARYFQRLSERSPLPVMMYNMPQCVKTNLAVETVAACSKLPNIAGIKDSAGDLALFAKLAEIKKLRADWSVLIGPEHLLGEAVRLGGDGGVCGGANLAPRLFVELFEAAAHSDAARAESLQRQVERLGAIYRLASGFSAVLRGTKLALSVAGLCENILADPYSPFGEAERRQIEPLVREVAREAAGWLAP
jgi:4-hydroxy-tetrahydrodipicolinate synthase